MPPAHLVVIPHTHWDREWYRTHEAFRVRLLALVDQVLDVLESDPEFRHFTLDGQTIVVDDYLAVRPGARERIQKLVGEGRLLVGPWHVLPDEWLVSGEALIRNLRFGLARAEALGGAMPLGYVPDQFGHVGQLPQVFRRFGFDGAVLWRGVGSDIRESGFWWEAPDGTRVFTLYLATSYGNATLLPLEPELLARRLARVRQDLAPFVRGTAYTLMNGSDHQPPQPGLPAALAAAVPLLADDAAGAPTFEMGTLPIALARVRREQAEAAPTHRGELRSGLRSPLLPGCASARLAQKQREFENDRLLTRVLEPLSAWAGWLGARVDRELLDFTWGVALENHPHDSICGCSIDAVHAQMETRFDRVADLAHAQLETVTSALADALEPPPLRAREGDAFAVWHGNHGGMARVEAELELDLPSLDPSRVRTGARVVAHVRDAAGRALPADVQVLEPGVVWRTPFSIGVVRAMLADLPREMLGLYTNAVSWTREGAELRICATLGSAPRGGFDFAAAKRRLVEALADPSLTELALDVRRPARLRVAFQDELPGHGLRVYRLAAGAVRGAAKLASGRLPAPGDGAFVESDAWRAEARSDGVVTLWHRASGTRIDDALRIVSEGDRGDTYNFDPVADAESIERPHRARVSVAAATASSATLRLDLRLRVPRELAPDRRQRGRKRVDLPVTVRLRVAAGLDRVDVRVDGTNTARDHRLRVLLRAPFAARGFEVESAFEVVGRPIAPARDAFGSPAPSEFPIGAGPQRSFSSLCGAVRTLTVAARGNSESEAVPEPNGTTSLAVTLLRAVGWLSGSDLALRPGPAGPGFATPGAQAAGPFHAELSLRLHANDDAERVAEAHRFAWPAWAFALGADAGPGAGAPRLRDGARLVEVDDPGIAVSALEPGAGGALRIRCYEANGRRRRLRARVPGAAALRAVDLAGRPDDELALEGSGEVVEANLRGAQLVDIEAQPAPGRASYRVS